MLVPTIRTASTDAELCKSLILSWQKVFNVIPSKQSICVIMAQHELETGGNNCWNYNLCNIKYSPSAGNVDYCALSGVWEIINGKKVMLTTSDPGSWFRSFPTLNDGTEFYIKVVSGSRYKNAWQAVVKGNPALFSHLLKLDQYYTADENQYTSIVVSFFNRYMQNTTYESVIQDMSPPVDETTSNTDTPPETPTVPESPVVDIAFDPPTSPPTANTPQPFSSGNNIWQLIQKVVKFLFPYLSFLKKK
jgi:hypothetical protein